MTFQNMQKKGLRAGKLNLPRIQKEKTQAIEKAKNKG